MVEVKRTTIFDIQPSATVTGVPTATWSVSWSFPAGMPIIEFNAG